MERVKHNFQFVNTNQSDGVGNRIKVDFHMVFSNIMNNVLSSENLFLSSGVAFYDEDEQVYKKK